MRETKYDELSAVAQNLLKAARDATSNSYAPYSKFRVGAALSTKSGRIITGVNVENASYGLTNCAERSAIFRAVSEGERMYESIAIVAQGENFDTKEVTGPCGTCRQVLHEFAQVSGKPLDVILATTYFDKILVTSTDELLPIPFGPLDIGIDLSRYRQ